MNRGEYREPEPGEVRQSGYAMLSGVSGKVALVASCTSCARTCGVTWKPDLFEGVCTGCECFLSGNVTTE